MRLKKKIMSENYRYIRNIDISDHNILIFDIDVTLEIYYILIY